MDHRSRRKPRRFNLMTLLLLASAAAGANEWTFAIDGAPRTSAELVPAGIDAAGFVLFAEQRAGFSTGRVASIHPDGRTHADVVSASVAVGRFGTTAGFVEFATPLEDAGISPSLGLYGPRPCALQRHVAGIELRRFGFNAHSALPGDPPVFDLDGGRFVTAARDDDRAVRRLAEDCASGPRIHLDGKVMRIVQRPHARGAIVLHRVAAGVGPPDRIALLDGTNVQHEQALLLEPDAPRDSPEAVSLRDGFVLLGQRDGAQRLQRYGEDGSLRFEYTPAAELFVLSVQPLADALLLRGFDREDGHVRLLLLAADGSDVDSHTEANPDFHSLLLPQSDPQASFRTLAIRPRVPGIAEYLVRVDAAGGFSVGAQLPAGMNAAAMLDDNSVIAERGADDGRFARIDANSGDTLTPMQVPEGADTFSHLSFVSIDPDGVAAATVADHAALRVSRFGSDGSPRWDRELDESAETRFRYFEAIASSAASTCVVSQRAIGDQSTRSVDCLAGNDGSDTLRRGVVIDAPGRVLLATLDPADTLHLAVGDTQTLRFVQVKTDGTEAASEAVAGGDYMIDDQQRQIGVSRGPGDSAGAAFDFEVYDAVGTSMRQTVSRSDLEPAQIVGLDADRRLLLELTRRAPQAGPLHLAELMPGSESRWQRSYPQWTPCHMPSIVHGVRDAEGDDWLVMFSLQDQPLTVDRFCGDTVLTRISGVDGSVLWSKQSRRGLRLDAAPQMFVDASNQRVALIDRPRIEGEREERILWRALQDGAPLAAASLPRSNEQQSAVVAAADSRLASVGTSRLPSQSRATVAVTRFPAFDSAPPLSQGALRGAWSMPGVPGQGLFLDFLPDADRVYGGWFTHRSEGGHDPAGLRWYLLVAQGTEQDGSVHFSIESSESGAFATAGNVSSRSVGSARLNLLDCNHANFAYTFDNDALSFEDGAIALERSTPASFVCNDTRDGPVVPVAAPARGLDARFGGAWQIDGVSGQGIAFDLRPPTTADPGLFAGAWFTFDPEAANDDPTAQHWFTLAGDLGEAADGRLSVPIYRTIGGALDREASNNTWRVGTATLTFLECDAATFEYRFDDSEVAHGFARLSGTAELSRVGGCGN